MKRWLFLPVLLAALAAWVWHPPRPLTQAALLARYDAPLPAQVPRAVYHLGHSLVGQDMPAMLAQLMGRDYRYNSQLGWGASLDQHWREAVPGHAEENRAPAFRPAHEALRSGDYDAVVLTEMVELRDAIRYHDSAGALRKWALLAREARPGVRLYLYETWHPLDDPAGWLTRIDRDLADLWKGGLLAPAMAEEAVGTIHVIPGGQVLAALVREAEAGRIPGLSRREDMFRRNPDGTQDRIHLNDLGAYVIALTHYAVLAGRSPVGLPHELTRADGRPAAAPAAETARAMQAVVWRVVRGYAPSGVNG